MNTQLTLENINKAVETTEAYLRERNCDNTEIIKLRLGLEEVLLRFRDTFGEEKEFKLSYGKYFGTTKIVLNVPGESYDPLSVNADDETIVMMRSLLTTLGNLPVWSYSRKTNKITFQVRRKPISDWKKILIAIFSAVIIGFSFHMFLPNIGGFIQEALFSPLINIFFAFLSALAGLMIFFSVIWGIYSMGDTNTISTLGKKITLSFFFSITASVLIAALFGLCIFRCETGASDFGEGFSSVYQMILDIIPTNFVIPFSEGNTLQILAIAIIIGFSMVGLGDKVRGFGSVAEQANYIFLDIMNGIAKIMPIFIFISIFGIIMENDKESITVVFHFLMASVAGCILLLLLHTLFTAFKVKKSPVWLWRNSFETFFVALSTASSAASFGSNLKTCFDKYHIDKKLVNFGIPFTQVLFKPGAALIYFMAVISVAESSHVSISLSWVITAIVFIIIVSAATPPVPGGSTAVFSLLFLQMGLPTDGLPIIIAVNILLDYIHTATNVFCGQMLVLRVGNKLKMIDEEFDKIE